MLQVRKKSCVEDLENISKNLPQIGEGMLQNFNIISDYSPSICLFCISLMQPSFVLKFCMAIEHVIPYIW